MGNDESTNEPRSGELVKSKAWHAWQLRLAGLSLSEIADRLKFTSGAAVAKAIKDEMMRDAKDIEPEERESLLDLEIARLDFMQARIWMAVEAGDFKAIETALKILQLRVRLRGLDEVDATKGQHTVLVVGGQEENYINQLKLVSGGD